MRELIQNSLDSGASDGSSLSVEFHYDQVQLTKIPCIKDYEAALHACEQTRKGQEQSPTERTVHSRMQQALRDPSVAVLTCVDNGKGIGPEAIRSLYGTGATTKPNRGRGSVGVGHLTAFAPSDLRYVLYAGRHAPAADGRTETFGGHAMLATARSNSRPDREHPDREQWAADGFIMPFEADQRAMFVSEAQGVPVLPDLLRRKLSDSTGSGSAVAICGYRPIKEAKPDEDLGKRMLTAVARNFTVAIHDGSLTVDYWLSGERIESLTKAELEGYLKSIKDQRRNRDGAGPRGQIAYRVWETLTSAHTKRLIDDTDGLRLWFRRLSPGERSHVSVFRDGMWITGGCPRLRYSDFDGFNPFDAVLDVRQSDPPDPLSLATLIREAEGASHLKITLSEIARDKDRGHLEERLEKLRVLLRDTAGALSKKRWTPEWLRIFTATEHGRPEVRQRAKPKPQDELLSPEVGIKEPVIDDSVPGDEQPVAGPNGGPRPILPRPVGASKGHCPAIRTTPLGVERDRITFAWQSPEAAACVGIRVALPSGSDETDKEKNKAKWLKIRALQCDSRAGSLRTVVPDRNDPYEVRLTNPPQQGSATIELSESFNPKDAEILIIDIVTRRAAQKSDAKTPES